MAGERAVVTCVIVTPVHDEKDPLDATLEGRVLWAIKSWEDQEYDGNKDLVIVRSTSTVPPLLFWRFGVEQARTDKVVLLDDESILPQGWLAQAEVTDAYTSDGEFALPSLVLRSQFLEVTE